MKLHIHQNCWCKAFVLAVAFGSMSLSFPLFGIAQSENTDLTPSQRKFLQEWTTHRENFFYTTMEGELWCFGVSVTASTLIDHSNDEAKSRADDLRTLAQESAFNWSDKLLDRGLTRERIFNEVKPQIDNAMFQSQLLGKRAAQTIMESLTDCVGR